jgi:hypothetical protein
MTRGVRGAAVATAVALMMGGETFAVTREIEGFSPARLTFGTSVLNQLTFGTYRTPFDELQTRPYDLLFANIGRYPNLTAWPGQEGDYARYVDALIGNNGAANVDNDADSIQGSMIRRETGALAWGLSAAVLAGNGSSDDASAGAASRTAATCWASTCAAAWPADDEGPVCWGRPAPGAGPRTPRAASGWGRGSTAWTASVGSGRLDQDADLIDRLSSWRSRGRRLRQRTGRSARPSTPWVRDRLSSPRGLQLDRSVSVSATTTASADAPGDPSTAVAAVVAARAGNNALSLSRAGRHARAHSGSRDPVTDASIRLATTVTPPAGPSLFAARLL